MFDRFTIAARKVLRLARNECAQFKHGFIGTEHFLLGLLKEDKSIAAAVLRNMGVAYDKVVEEIEIESSNTPPVGIIPFTKRAKQSLEAAVEEAAHLRHNYIGPEHILLGLLDDEKGAAVQILIKLNADIDDVRADVLELVTESIPLEEEEEEKTVQAAPKRKAKGKKNKSALEQFGRDLTKYAEEGKLDPVIGRKDEIERVLLVLARRNKNNPILLGEPGVGKTAIVEGIAQQIVDGKAPEMLNGYKLIALDLAAMVAGTKYRGQFEDRIKAVMAEATKEKVVLFIDEIHTLVGAGGAEGAIDAANVLKPALSRGEIRCIGATTLDEYRKSLEKDGALARRFQKVIIDPPTPEQTERIISGVISKYEKHHKVKYSRDALKAAVALAERYITSRFLPDKALDVVDEAGARVVLEKHRPKKLSDAEMELELLCKSKDDAVANQEFEEAAALRDKIEKLETMISDLHKTWKREKKKIPTVSKTLIAKTISKMTGIPVENLSASEAEKLLALEEHLSEIVIGQDKAKRQLSKSLRKTRAGLGDPKRPMGCYLFVGPTGVGKTLLAKAMAKIVFDSEDALITLDMSEYSEKINVSRLVGAAPGYVGYDEGGQLTEAVRRKPYSIVLFDEIEKAHPEVFNILLQIMEEGQITDSQGRKVSFKNTIVILTSNVGSSAILNKSSLGFGIGSETSEEMIERQIKDDLNKTFKPEFLNRLDAKVIFTQLTREELYKVLDLELDKVKKRLAAKTWKLDLTQSAKDFLLDKGYNPEYGARPLRRAVGTYVEDFLAEAILKGSFITEQVILLDKDPEEDSLKLAEVIEPISS